MIKNTKTVLYLYLNKKKYEFKQHEDLAPYLGGVGTSLKLFCDLKDYLPVVFSVGPLTGLFPYLSKTCAVYGRGDSVFENYIGGPLAVRLKFAGIDSIVILGEASQRTVISIEDRNVKFVDSISKAGGVYGRRCVVSFEKGTIIEGYFTFGENDPASVLVKRGLIGMQVTGSGSVEPKELSLYEKLYGDILQRVYDLSVPKGKFPSCSSCPVGCKLSYTGEKKEYGRDLTHSLVGCGYSQKIYEDISTVFSCLNSIGYSYTHEELENLGVLISNLRNAINNS